jgi:hypothetical protein
MLQRTDNSWKPQSRRDLSDQITPILAINGIIVLALLILALSVPSASEWISAASEFESFGGVAPAATPTQTAEHLEAIKVVQSK